MSQTTTKIMMMSILMLITIPLSTAVGINEIEDFLINDPTDRNEYTQLYTCGHFSRDLSYNASLLNLTIGAIAITENNFPLIKGYCNHLINYFEVDGTLYFIEPQSDQIMTAEDVWNKGYNHGKLYPDGTQAPTNFRGAMSATYDLSEHLDETLPVPVWTECPMNRVTYN